MLSVSQEVLICTPNMRHEDFCGIFHLRSIVGPAVWTLGNMPSQGKIIRWVASCFFRNDFKSYKHKKTTTVPLKLSFIETLNVHKADLK